MRKMKTEKLHSAGDTLASLREDVLPPGLLFKGHRLSCKRWTKNVKKNVLLALPNHIAAISIM